jgi:hypothetical protein
MCHRKYFAANLADMVSPQPKIALDKPFLAVVNEKLSSYYDFTLYA